MFSRTAITSGSQGYIPDNRRHAMQENKRDITELHETDMHEIRYLADGGVRKV